MACSSETLSTARNTAFNKAIRNMPLRSTVGLKSVMFELLRWLVAEESTKYWDSNSIKSPTSQLKFYMWTVEN